MSRCFPPPVLSRERDSTQDILTCTLCHELVMEPVMTPCDHIFCRPCIIQALQHKRECPNDRKPLSHHQLQPVKGMLRRIWEQVGVKCPNPGCDWTGTAGNYENHATTCCERLHLAGQQEEEYKRRITKLQEELSAERARVHNLQEALNNSHSVTSELVDTHRKELKAAMLGSFDSSYSYGREQVVELAQLICRNLEAKPNKIDANRIYNCVRTCYEDLRRYSDNPNHYYVDMRMLLNICLASTWFTNRQIENIRSWCNQQGWKGL